MQTEYTVKLGGVSELDETFVLDSYKGKKLVHHGKLWDRQKRGRQKEHERLLIVAAKETRKKSRHAPRREYRNRDQKSRVQEQNIHDNA